jgi:hypothetical protein
MHFASFATSKPGVGTSADAARMSAYATMDSDTLACVRKLSDIAHECVRHE